MYKTIVIVSYRQILIVFNDTKWQLGLKTLKRQPYDCRQQRWTVGTAGVLDVDSDDRRGAGAPSSGYVTTAV